MAISNSLHTKRQRKYQQTQLQTETRSESRSAQSLNRYKMTTESDCLVMGLCASRPGLVSSSKSSSSRKNVDSADDGLDKYGAETGSDSNIPPRELYFPDPKVGLESSTFSEKEENAAMKLERDLIRSDQTWYWEQMNLAMGSKYGERLPSEIHRVSPATRMALLRNMQNHPKSQIEEEGYDSDTHGNTMIAAIGARDQRALFYRDHPEELCSERQSNSQIWFANAPPVEARPPPGEKPWDGGIFDREKAVRPMPEEHLYFGAGDPLEPAVKSSRRKSKSKQEEENAKTGFEEEEGDQGQNPEPLIGEGLKLLCGIVGSLKRKKKPDSV